LRVEKAAADEAPRSAEAANRAKTQFFAAASHDLRQPLHAMGLFAEALRQRASDPEVASLVNSINQSVDALEGLFGELLDITRIDSGGVDVQPAPVRIRDLFARLRCTSSPRLSRRDWRCAFTASSASPTPMACCSSASCATWSATRSATPTDGACWWRAGSSPATPAS
jgi:signal transduction histidine kinase